DVPLALAGLAATALDVEREPARAVPSLPRLLRGCEDLADAVEQPRIRRRVGARRAPDRLLANRDQPSRRTLSIRGALRDADEQRALAGPRHAGNRGAGAERHVDRNVLQVVQFEPGEADCAPDGTRVRDL